LNSKAIEIKNQSHIVSQSNTVSLNQVCINGSMG